MNAAQTFPRLPHLCRGDAKPRTNEDWPRIIQRSHGHSRCWPRRKLYDRERRSDNDGFRERWTHWHVSGQTCERWLLVCEAKPRLLRQSVLTVKKSGTASGEYPLTAVGTRGHSVCQTETNQS
jgi:hypothetical protein